MYGPAIDNDFATQQVGVPLLLAADGHRRQAVRRLDRHADHADHDAAGHGADQERVGPVRRLLPALAVQVHRGRATAPRLDLGSEQQILRQPVNRQECCHVAGDIDFDTHNNLWLVTGDDNPAGGINGGGYAPMNDQLTDEQQIVRLTNATGGTYTLTFNGQTTAPLAFNATGADVDAALEALSNIEANEIQTSGGPANTANLNVFFRRGKRSPTRRRSRSTARP